MAGDRSPGVLSRQRFGLLLLAAAAAAGLCGGVSAVKSPSCHEVRTAFQIRQIGPLKLVPDVPTAESDLQICQHRAPTCCTKKMEENYQTAVRRERTQNIQALNFELKYMIVGHITAFQEAFESLLRFAENHTTSLFETAYRAMAKEAAEPVKELFTDLSLYILGAETTVENAVLRFFDSLFPLVYSRLINPGIIDLSEEYTECLRLTRQDINPFGRYSNEVVTELSKSLWASRMLNQALNMGIEVINTTEHAAITKECSKALVKMQYCPHCQGLTLIRPCVGYCLNVMRGCLASVSELDTQWREYISALEYLTNEMAGSHDLELALLGIRNSINEAILHAQLNGPQLSATVDKVCGQPQEREAKPSPDNIVQAKDMAETQALTMAHSANLNNKRREFINYMKRSRTFYASIAERLCDGDLVMRDSSTCWNGEDVVESYTSRVVSNGLKAQINNPELKVKGLDPLISHLIDRLHHFNQLDTEKTKLKLERWASRESGSGGWKSEAMESSGDCDDEDGCQGSGDRIHTAVNHPCSEAVWRPTTPLREEPSQTPKWVEPVDPAPAPQRSRRRTGSRKAQPRSSVGQQQLERPDTCGLAPVWETPASRSRPEDWLDWPMSDADRCTEELPSLPLAGDPEELPSLPLAGDPEEPMVLEPSKDTTLTQVPYKGESGSSLGCSTARANVSVLRPGPPLTQKQIFGHC